MLFFGALKRRRSGAGSQSECAVPSAGKFSLFRTSFRLRWQARRLRAIVVVQLVVVPDAHARLRRLGLLKGRVCWNRFRWNRCEMKSASPRAFIPTCCRLLLLCTSMLCLLCCLSSCSGSTESSGPPIPPVSCPFTVLATLTVLLLHLMRITGLGYEMEALLSTSICCLSTSFRTPRSL